MTVGLGSNGNYIIIFFASLTMGFREALWSVLCDLDAIHERFQLCWSCLALFFF